MQYEFIPAVPELSEELAEIRLLAMKDSLQAVGRYNPSRARERFLNGYEPANTVCVMHNNDPVGFYVLITRADHLYLDHLYINPIYQGNGIGSEILNIIKTKAKSLKLPIRLGALKQSNANRFYASHGFVLTHHEEWDNYYQFTP